MIALLSVKPEFAERIFNGIKKFEYRKKVFARKDVEKIIVYASSPMKCVIGEFEFDNIILDTPSIIWEKTAVYSGINHESFFKYFSGSRKAYAICITHAIRYANPVNLQNMLPGFTPPQSFRYIKPAESLLFNATH